MGRLIHMGSDHGGFALKNRLSAILVQKGYEINDLGTYTEDSVDYPELGKKVALAVLEDGNPGIIICGTGIGISIAANRFKGIRAALCHNVEYAKLSREHNNANILALGGRFLDDITAEEITDAFLKTEFMGGRHRRRVELLDNI